MKRTDSRALREVIATLLEAGGVIDPAQVADQLALTVPEHEAAMLWLRSMVSRAVHRTARDMGIVALSLGRGKGFKTASTAEEMQLARARAEAQLRGHSSRGKRLRERLALLNQRVLPLEGVVSDAADGAPKPAHTISA